MLSLQFINVRLELQITAHVRKHTQILSVLSVTLQCIKNMHIIVSVEHLFCQLNGQK